MQQPTPREGLLARYPWLERARWALVFFLLFPGFALGQPADEGTRVDGAAGMGRHHYESGCGPLFGYTVRDSAVGGRVQHRDGLLRASAGLRYNEGEVTSGRLIDPTLCEPNELCEPDEIGDVGQVVGLGLRAGVETKYFGFELGPLAIAQSRAGEKSELDILPSAMMWGGVPDFYIYGEAGPLGVDPNSVFSLEVGLGHQEKDFEINGGGRIGFATPGGEVASGFLRLDRALTDQFWLGAEFSGGPSDNEELFNYAATLRVSWRFGR